MPEKYRIIGLMSGSSLDGLDIACCDFSFADGTWQFSIPHASCLAYNTEWTEKLRHAHEMGGRDLWHTHAAFGKLCGDAVRNFIADNAIENVLAVASHGHTVFHEPKNGFTTQIGDGAALAAASGLPVICDFRSGDVAKGGQGAPLVPIGDWLLFGQHRFLLNIGGIANVTVRQDDETLAFDIGAANQVLNFYAAQRGLEYDRNGALAASGSLCLELFDALNDLAYYAQSAPKSLGNDHAREIIVPLIERQVISVEDKLHTFCEHIAWQTGRHIAGFHALRNDTLLASGGGVFNAHLLSRLHYHVPVQIVVPDDNIIHYKEALIFAFLGVLRWRGEVNILKAVTGAGKNSISGAIYEP